MDAALARFPVSVPLPRFNLVSTDSSCHMMPFNCGQIRLNPARPGLHMGCNRVCDAPVTCCPDGEEIMGALNGSTHLPVSH